jgi:DNA-binding CsgD family transcriptional regulator
MSSALASERVRRDVEVLATAGLDLAEFLDEVHQSLQRAVPHSGACANTVDPATQLATAAFKFGAMAGADDHDAEWCLIEYGDPDATSFRALGATDDGVARLRHDSGDDPTSIRRYRDYFRPHFGIGDELRAVVRAEGTCWGGLALFRSEGEAPFSDDDAALLGSLSTHLANGYRSGILVRLLSDVGADAVPGPATVIVDPTNQVRQASVGARERLDELGLGLGADGQLPVVVAALVAGARRFSAGELPVLPRSRIRTAAGHWLVLHASPLDGAGAGASAGDVVVTIEEARPPEIVPLVVAAFDLTPRERDVIQLVLSGTETKQIARSLHLSAYTVQDHLKSIFEKAGVHSRRELLGRVFFDQYAPRFGASLAPSGWFQEPSTDDGTPAPLR